MPRYKHGKQKELISFEEIQEKVAQASRKLNDQAISFFWLLYYCGVRKSEAYERTVENCQLTETHFIVDFGQRKKGGEKVPPLKLPLWFPGVNLIVKQWRRASKSKRGTRKLLEIYEDKQRITKKVRARWLFPHVHRAWALTIVKTVLGSKYYPHFLRLNRLTDIGTDETANLTRMKSFSGIKTVRVLEGYMGVSTKEQDKAVDFMAKQIKEKQQKGSQE